MVVKPLVLVDGAGVVLDAAIMNSKAYTKSTEHRKLWSVNPETGRVLPYRGNIPFTDLSDQGDIYRATVDKDAWDNAVVSSNQSRPTGKESLEHDGYLEGEHDRWEKALRSLVAVIQERKATLPEGSYTTYLFNAGESKIRKKTGEEAIELVLAETAEETTSEAADLVYHLLVLLAQLEIPFDKVIEELENRS